MTEPDSSKGPEHFPEYDRALEYLYAQLPMFSRIGAAAYKPGLERVVALSDFFDNPHRQFRSIHIAGTNGKGSTSHMIAAVLQAAGYRTALYTSPHLVDFRERMRIDGHMIPREKVVDFVNRWAKAGYAGDPPSFFELTMLMAFEWFASEDVDIAVIETGMGGRLDSTNIITPLLSVITNISSDHTQFLGDTLTQIAEEKAGIIKNEVPVIIGEADGEVEKVFDTKASRRRSPLIKAWLNREATGFTMAEDYSGWNFNSRNFGPLFVDLAGDYQTKNVNTALSAIVRLRKDGIPIPDEAVRAGLGNVCGSTGLEGRWKIVANNPLTICDTGHNEGGLAYTVPRLISLLNQSRRRAPGARLRMVVGFVADKDVDHILQLFPTEAIYYFTNADIPRALPADDLKIRAEKVGLTGQIYPTVPIAVRAALADANQSDIIFIGGSTFIVADYLKGLG